MSGKKQTTNGNSLLEAIAHILGVNDVSQLIVSPDMSLGDIGFDSLMGVEIRQALERDHNTFCSTKELRNVRSKIRN